MLARKKLVAHTCCAVCMCYPSTILEGYDTVFYFYNPNIYPNDEYERRKKEFIEYTSKNNINIFIEDTNAEDWYKDIAGFEKEKEGGERCKICFKHRLMKTFEYAKSINADLVTTVMTVSPHKNSSVILDIGLSLANKYENIEYLNIDFKKKDGFKKNNILANNFGLYRQNYCGCKYSIRN